MSSVLNVVTTGAGRDFAQLALLKNILEQEGESPAFKIEALYSAVFERTESARTWELAGCREWNSFQITRALGFIEEIAPLYAQAFQDPRELPVTHSKRQKRVAIHLDQQFAKVLREAAERSGAFSWMNDDERLKKDDFLDEPILFLKQEARRKGFPHTKKGGGPSLSALRERYAMKLAARGVKPLGVAVETKEERYVPPGP